MKQNLSTSVTSDIFANIRYCHTLSFFLSFCFPFSLSFLSFCSLLSSFLSLCVPFSLYFFLSLCVPFSLYVFPSLSMCSLLSLSLPFSFSLFSHLHLFCFFLNFCTFFWSNILFSNSQPVIVTPHLRCVFLLFVVAQKKAMISLQKMAW